MRVTVSCSSAVCNEDKTSAGADQAVRLFTIDAGACNGSTSCRSGCAEARRQVQATS